MNHIYYILFFFLSASNVLGQQNLILNGDFEEYWECPDNLTQIEKCKYVYNPCGAAPPPQWSSTSDYFNRCAPTASGCGVPYNIFGYQEPQNGDGYVGLAICDIWGEYKEYIYLSITNELVPYSIYEFSIYINLTNNGGYTSNNLGFVFIDELTPCINYLSESMITDVEIDNLTITDTIDWQKISFSYTAKSKEKYIIIGNFNSNASENCLYNHESSNPLLGEFAYFYFDDAALILIKEAEPITFPNVFTPNNDALNDEFTLLSGQNHFEKLTVFNRWGNIVFDSDSSYTWNGKDKDGKDLTEGVYFVIITGKIEKEGIKEQYQGMVHLIR